MRIPASKRSRGRVFSLSSAFLPGFKSAADCSYTTICPNNYKPIYWDQTGVSNEMMNRTHVKSAKDSVETITKAETKFYHSIPEIQVIIFSYSIPNFSGF